MNSLKDIIVDICVTVFIAVTVWLYDPWMWWVIVIYTILMLIAKGFTLYSESFLQHKPQTNNKDDRINYTLYALNIILLAYATWWYLAALWSLIWLLTYIGKLKAKQSSS